MQNMNPLAYLNVSVDHLFEQHTISNIDNVHKNLENEIEQKKQEIRKFVGERYRDLIQAADSINDMKTTSSGIISQINAISVSCKRLNDEQLIGFRTEPDAELKQERLRKNRFYSVLLQIKILTRIPELLWHHLENEDFFVASQLYVFSRHITTGLKLQSNAEIVQKIPAVNSIWESLNPFYAVIKETCITTLEKEDLCSETAVKCLSSILLLENCDYQKLLSIFMNGRLNSFKDVLNPEGQKYEKAREKIIASLKILIDTVEMIHEVFLQGGLLYKELNQLTSDQAIPSIELIFTSSDTKLNLLPDIVRYFKPQVVIPVLEPEVLKSSLNSWLETVEKISQSELESLVLLITSIKTIQDMKKQTSALKQSKNWSSICLALQLPDNIDFYERFYQNLINRRLQDIIQNAWNNALNETLVDVESMLVTNENAKLKSWLWKEEFDDCPKSLKSALAEKKDQKKLLMKVAAFTPDIVNVCTKLDKKLEIVFDDVKVYLNVEQQPGNRQSACDPIVIFLNECSAENVSRLITELKTLKCLEDKHESYVFLARLLYAVPILCPNLRMCLSSSTLSTGWPENNTENLYNKCSSLLHDESFNFWMLWLESFVKKLDQILKRSSKQLDSNTILKDFPSWDVITIEEKDEQDNAVKSTIRIPSTPSFPLQKFLHETCSLLNEIIPHTLPKKVSSTLLEKVALLLHNHYKTISENDFVKNNQNTALQYYFDIKFVHCLLVSREYKTLVDQFNELTDIYKNYIDPFDFDVFFVYLNENLKSSVQRMRYQLGYLSSTMDQSILPGSNINSSKQDRDPNVLSTNATNITWFPLLPISENQSNNESLMNVGLSVSSSSSKLQSMTESSEQTLPTSKSSTSLDKTIRTAQNYADNVKSGAAAFFGDWFKS